ncbi:MAG: magnesium transporter MgtE N-terminal domain-containing protein [Candidatus Binatia bacterium]
MNSDWPLARTFLEKHPYEAGLVLEKLAPAQIAALLREMPLPTAAGVLEQMTSATGAGCLLAFPLDYAGPVIESLSLDAAARMLRCLPASERDRLLGAVSDRRAAPLTRLLTYPLGTAGSLMDPQVPALPESLLVGDALGRVQRAAQYTFYYVYVVNPEQTLVGVMNLRELMLAVPQDHLSAVMHTHVERLPASAALPTILLHPAWREFHALPVTDGQEKFLGAIRYKTLKRLEQESARQRPADESLTALLSLGELCWIGFAGMLAGLAATVFPRTLPLNRGEENTRGAND